MKLGTTAVTPCGPYDVLDIVTDMLGMPPLPKMHDLSKVPQALAAFSVLLGGEMAFDQLGKAVQALCAPTITPTADMIASDKNATKQLHLGRPGVVSLSILDGVGAVVIRISGKIDLMPLAGPGVAERTNYLRSVETCIRRDWDTYL